MSNRNAGSGRITLHPEHGLNPTLCVCFWCGRDRGDIALLGYNKGQEAPRRCVTDLEPCDVCRGQWAQGILVREARAGLDGPEFTGRWLVLSREAVERAVEPKELREAVLKKGQMLMRPEDWKRWFGEIGEIEKKE